MSPSERVMIPFLSELTLGGIRPGTILLVEFDPDSQWFAVSITMAGNVIQNGGNVAFNAMARSPEEIENELSTLGVDVPRAFKEGRLSINDWYSATLSGGRIEPLTPGASVFEDRDTQKGSKCLSLKVQDLSVEFLKDSKVSRESSRFYRPDWPAGTLNVVDSFSALLRFNDEKSTADYFESRLFPEQRKAQRITIMGLVRGIHSDWLYKRTEAATDGVVDIRVMEEEGKARNFVRVRSLRGQPHDSAWHQIEIKPNGEAGLVRS